MYSLGARPRCRSCDLADGSDKGGPYNGFPYGLSCARSDGELSLMANVEPPRLAVYGPVTRIVTPSIEGGNSQGVGRTRGRLERRENVLPESVSTLPSRRPHPRA